VTINGINDREVTMKVNEIMRWPVVVIRDSDTIEQAAKMMLQHNLRGLPVVDDEGYICGFISVSDYLARNKRFPFSRDGAPQLFGKWISGEGIEEIYEEARTIPVGKVMSTPAFTVNEDDSVEILVELMLSQGLSRIPVVKDRIPIGIVARFDLLKMVIDRSSVTQDAIESYGGQSGKEENKG
jgi:CBS domain-containing protein